uniref:Uncharacterized protein n=1 Tax=Stegastes partitus TaxID=144197 RepID=A0A3B5AKV2_9TELE
MVYTTGDAPLGLHTHRRTQSTMSTHSKYGVKTCFSVNCTSTKVQQFRILLWLLVIMAVTICTTTSNNQSAPLLHEKFLLGTFRVKTRSINCIESLCLFTFIF